MSYLTIALFAALGLISTVLMVRILDAMPARCFCDYEETPSELHNPPRVSRKQCAICAVILAAVFPLLAVRFGVSVKAVSLCFLCVCLTMISLSDLRFCIIPDELIIAGCIFATVSAFPGILSGQDWLQRLSPVLGAAIGAGTILIINLVGRLVYKKDALGMGDLKLMIVCGITCGTSGAIIAMLVGILAAGIWFSLAIALKRVHSDDYLPLGPFLVLGTVFTICFRPTVDTLLAWYISLI